MVAARVPDKATQRKAVSQTARLRKKRDAAPSWQTLIDTFGEAGATRNARGKVTGYTYPKSDDPVKQREINNKVYEMWDPHRRVSIGLGLENSAAVPTVRVRDRKTGVAGTLPEEAALAKEQKGAVALAPGHRATARMGPDGRLVRADGTEPPSRFHEIVESGKAPAGFVH